MLIEFKAFHFSSFFNKKMRYFEIKFNLCSENKVLKLHACEKDT